MAGTDGLDTFLKELSTQNIFRPLKANCWESPRWPFQEFLGDIHPFLQHNYTEGQSCEGKQPQACPRPVPKTQNTRAGLHTLGVVRGRTLMSPGCTSQEPTRGDTRKAQLSYTPCGKVFSYSLCPCEAHRSQVKKTGHLGSAWSKPPAVHPAVLCSAASTNPTWTPSGLPGTAERGTRSRQHSCAWWLLDGLPPTKRCQANDLC